MNKQVLNELAIGWLLFIAIPYAVLSALLLIVLAIAGQAQTTTCPGVLSISASLGGCDSVFIGWTHTGPLAVQSQTLVYGDGFSPALGTSERSYSRTGVGCSYHSAVTVTQRYTNNQTCVAYYNDNHNRPCDQCGASSQPMAVINAATSGISGSPNSIISCYQADFGISTSFSASSLPLPTVLGGISVFVNGQIAPLFFASQGQINALIPPNTQVGNALVQVQRPDGSITSGPMPLFDAQPGLFVGAGGYAAVTIERRNGVVILTLWGTGFNILVGVQGSLNTGSATVRLGSRTYAAIYVGPSYTAQGPMPGLDQLNFVIPANEAPNVGAVLGAQVTMTRNVNDGFWASNAVDVRF